MKSRNENPPVGLPQQFGVFAAFQRAWRDLFSRGMLWHVLWPPLLASALWIAIAAAFWVQGIAVLESLVPELPWSGWEWVSQWAAAFLMLAAVAMLTYVTALLLVAVVALPLIVNRVAQQDYSDLTRHGENVFWGSLGNTLGAGALFVVGGLFSLPLLLIPGVVLVLPVAWAAWLNQRTYRFDALAEHATRAELAQLVKYRRSQFYLAGGGTALFAHLPVIQLLAPVFTALVFVHLGLAALRQLRQQQGVQL